LSQFPTSKLTEHEQRELVTRIAMYYKPREIVDWVKKDLGKSLTPKAVYQYAKSEKWKPFIEKQRKLYTSQIMEHPLANKRKRVEELEKLFSLNLKKGRLSEARQVIRELRAEVEGEKGDGKGNQYFISQNFNQMSDEELEDLKMKQLNIISKFKERQNAGKIGSPETINRISIQSPGEGVEEE